MSLVSNAMSARGRAGALLPLILIWVLLDIAVHWAASQPSVEGSTFSGYASATALHAHAIEVNDVRIENAEAAFSGASISSQGLASPLLNELNMFIHSPLPDKTSFGRGSGLEFSAATTTPVEGSQIVLAQQAEASSPNPTELITNEFGPVPLNPVAYASLLRGQARARSISDGCALGTDASYGLGSASQVQLIDAGGGSADGPELEQPLISLDAAEPDRAVSQSVSRTRLVPQTTPDGALQGANLGLMSEARVTLAPVTLFRGTTQQTTIEVLGEWVLRAVATGVPGGGYIHYGPEEASPETPVLRIINALGQVTDVLTLQQITGDAGLVVEVPGIAQIATGENPRAIAGSAGSLPTTAPDGTLAAAAVDVLRLELLEQPAAEIADLRLGHMEVKAQVPAGGIECFIQVSKQADQESVPAGDEFSYLINIANPYDCPLTSVRVIDKLEADRGVRFGIVSHEPSADQVMPNEVTWNDIGPIAPQESKNLTMRVLIDARSAVGRLTNTVEASGNCGVAAAQGGVTISVPVVGKTSLDAPQVRVLGSGLARTGPKLWMSFVAFVMLAIALGTLNALRSIPKSSGSFESPRSSPPKGQNTKF